jgi:hypothetical protein
MKQRGFKQQKLVRSNYEIWDLISKNGGIMELKINRNITGNNAMKCLWATALWP